MIIIIIAVLLSDHIPHCSSVSSNNFKLAHTIMSVFFIPLLLFLSLHSQPASSIQLAVSSAARKCFTEQVPRGATIYAEFRASSSRNPFDITLLVANELGHIVSQKPSLTHHKFTIVPPRQHNNNNHAYRNPLETYRFCLIPQTIRNHHYSSNQIRVSFSIKTGDGGIGASSFDLLKASHVEQTNQKIRELDDTLNTLLFGMDTLRRQEHLLSQQNAATSRHIITVSSLTSIVVITVGILQFDAVKEVLRKRKVIP